MHITRGDTRITLRQGDITREEVDAIVNAANESLAGGGGVDGAIHRAGGPDIMAECREIGGCPTGEAVATTAGDLPARRVIHTVGPRWRGGDAGERQLLANAYRNSLAVARDEGLRTVAFPCISAGIYGYPGRQACDVAVSTVLDEVDAHPDAFDEIRFVVFGDDDRRHYEERLES